MNAMETVTEVLRMHAERSPDRTLYLYLEDGERESARLTYGEFYAKALRIAAKLRTMTAAGDRALLLYPPGLEFISAWMGCLYAGVVAVPAYPPRKHRASQQRVQSIMEDCSPAIAMMDSTTFQALEKRSEGYSATLAPAFLITDGEFEIAEERPVTVITSDTLAMLQYTSGSTGTPKGVMIRHGNIMANMAAVEEAAREDATAVYVGWLPLFHDMGLFGQIVHPLVLGGMSVLMAPAAFVQKPLRWLRAITAYRGTAAAAPDSAYLLCARSVSEADKVDLDLSSWKLAYNGAEPIRAESIERFAAAFASCGFDRDAMYPVYGLAEATLFVTANPAGTAPALKTLDSAELDRGIAFLPAPGTKTRTLVSCGRTWDGHEIRIVDPASMQPCAANHCGEIWITGASIGAGYWNRAEESERTFRARLPGDDRTYLRTGDLGFLDGGDLVVTGRSKDLIIVAGRNLYPQDIEATAEKSYPALVTNASAAFALDFGEGESVVIVCEVRRDALRTLDKDAAFRAIRQAVTEEHEIPLHAVILLKTSTVPRTSSGKIQRSACKAAFLAGEGLDIVGQWRQPRVQESSSSLASIAEWLVEWIAQRTGQPSSGIDIHAPFSAFGLGSLDAVEMSGKLQQRLGRNLPPTLVYDFPSIDLLARHLGPDSSRRTHAHTSTTTTQDTAIAVVGMGCRFADARNPDEFWKFLVEGLDSKNGLRDVDMFDAEFFGINAREAEAMDPQQRMLLEVAWETLENACVVPSTLAGTRTAVVVGISNAEYARLAMGDEATGPYIATGNALSVAANRISHVLDLRGPSWAVDTACSSSLLAVHQACGMLRHNECDAVLAGGANLILTPQLSEAFTRAGMLSPDHQCRTFDEAANGYARGEGVGMVLLKRLQDAVDAGDTILAVVHGSAANQDGRSHGLTAPNGPSQQAVIREALAMAGTSPAEIGYVEAHGTGTPLGDPIEMNSLMEVLKEDRTAEAPCWIGSVKTNIGHLEAAAGIAAFMKTVLALQHRRIPAHLHYHTLNPHIALDGSLFRIPIRTVEWPCEDGTRRGGVSSFGFGGTNVHVVLGDVASQNDASRPKREGPFTITISAKTVPALRALAGHYAAYIESHPAVRLDDLAFSIAHGRTRFEHPMTVTVSTIEELRDAWSGMPASDRQGTIPSSGRKLALPTYPFERRSYWFQKRSSTHPLLGRQTEQRHSDGTWTWHSAFDGPESAFLAGHRLMEATVLPYSAYIEMALSAASQAVSEGAFSVAGLNLHKPLILRERETRSVRSVLSRRSGTDLGFEVYSQTGAATSTWHLCASATLLKQGGQRS
jgi:acyl-CoA synthetase (AMP-forming)/AMP-acid ligase II/3-oxoacyl-(acyl-carrier-protein) synthase/acyl carrier protein